MESVPIRHREERAGFPSLPLPGEDPGDGGRRLPQTSWRPDLWAPASGTLGKDSFGVQAASLWALPRLPGQTSTAAPAFAFDLDAALHRSCGGGAAGVTVTRPSTCSVFPTGLTWPERPASPCTPGPATRLGRNEAYEAHGA